MKRLRSLLKKRQSVWVFGYLPLYLIWFLLLERFVVTFHVIHTPIDDRIPFCEYFIIPYVIWYFYIAFTLIYFMFNGTDEFFRALIMLYTGMTVFLVFSTLYPTGHLLRPHEFPRQNFCTAMVRFLYKIDTSTNIVPSIHVFNSVGCYIAITKNRRLHANPWAHYGFMALTVLIVMSTVFLKQHSFVDVVTGGLLAYLLYFPIYEKMPPFLKRWMDRFCADFAYDDE